MKRSFQISMIVLFVLLAATAHARTIKMIFWYPGEAGTTQEAQPVLDEFTKLVNLKLAPDAVSGKYFNTVDGGLAFIKNERPAIGIVSYAAWAQNKDKLGMPQVILATLPLPHGKSTEQYRLVGSQDKLTDNSIVFSSEPLLSTFVRAELFPNMPQGIKVTQTNQILMKLKEIGDGRLSAFAILTPNEAVSLTRLTAPWAKNLKAAAHSKPVPTARVVSFENASAEKLKSVLLSIGGDTQAADVLTELRLKGFANE